MATDFLQAQEILRRVFQSGTNTLTGLNSVQDYLNAVYDNENDALRISVSGGGGVMVYKGEINVAGDFPAADDRSVGDYYSVTANVTDPVTTTNFLAGDEIFWNGVSWTLVGNITGVTPGGVDGEIQYNNAGAFGGTATVATLTDAITRRHTQGTDLGLDTGGVNPVTAAQARAAWIVSHVQGTDQGLDTGGLNAVTAAQIVAALAQLGVYNLADLFSAFSQPTGFPNITDSTVTFVDGTRTLTVAPVGATFIIWVSGIPYELTTQNVVITDTEGTWWFYFDKDTRVLTATQTFVSDIFVQHVVVAIGYWDAANNALIYLAEERHGVIMSGESHLHMHTSFGTQYYSGLALGDFTSDGDGSLAIHAELSVGSGAIRDEDLSLSLAVQAIPAQIPVFYKTGATGLWRRDTARDFPVKQFVGGAGRLAWNEEVVGVWQQTEVDNLDFVLAHIVATNDPNMPFIAVQGQSEYNNLNLARIGAATEVQNLVVVGLPFEEFLFVGTIIFQTGNGYGNVPKARIRTTDLGDDWIDFRQKHLVSTGGASDHSSLGGLPDDTTHLLYLLLDGTRAMTGDLDMGYNAIDSVINQELAITVHGVDLTAVAQTDIYTVPAGYRFIVEDVQIVIDSITGAAAMPTIQFGIDGDEAGWVGATQLDASMNAANEREIWEAIQDALPAATVFEFGVTIGGASTTHVATVVIRGYLLEA